MLRTRACELLGIRHPVALGGMSTGTSPELVAAVSNAGGFGIQGVSGRSPSEISALVQQVRDLTQQPFGLNLLLFMSSDEQIQAVVQAGAAAFSTAWRWPDQDLRPLFTRAHASGARVLHMASTLAEAEIAAEAGADAIVAQGTEGGGHVGLMGTLPLVRMVVRAVAPLPVLAAGGIADGAGLVAALALGAEGVLLGTRFLATVESPLPEAYKQAIVASDGHDTLVTEIPDVASGQVWPGAYARTYRNQFVQRWIGRTGDLRAQRRSVAASLQQARAAGDVDNGALLFGQDAGLIDAVEPAGQIVERLVFEAEQILRERMSTLLTTTPPAVR
jgi:NAD(P)H-dependent flavin oxidoreductase YrpB (nitropropane dioxygenase family)